MADVEVQGRSQEKAVLLLAAAAKLKLDSAVVRTTSDGYLAPQEVVDEAFGDDKKKSSKSAKAEGTKE